MIRAGFVSSAPQWHWERQFPGSVPVWGDVEFVFSGDFADCDVVFVYDAIPDEFSGRLVAKRCMFIASEPVSVKTYRDDFLAQFDCVLTTDRSTRHPNTIYGQLGLPWHVGAWDSDGRLMETPMTIDDFKVFQPVKTKTVSVVASNKAFTHGHRARLAFVQKLKSYFGEEIDVFGRNINGFGDKAEVLSEYRYHIAMENSSYTDYWTEKLSDPYLTNTYPIYYGCPNVSSYFDEQALTAFDLNDYENAIVAIKRLISSDEAEVASEYLKEAKMRVMYKYNIFNVLSNSAQRIFNRKERFRALFSEKEYEKDKIKFRIRRTFNLVKSKLTK